MNPAIEILPANSARPPAYSGQARSIFRAVLVVATLPAALVPFLPFAWDVSPLKAVGEGIKSFDGVGFFLIGAPFFLGLPIVLAQFRTQGDRSLTRFEGVVAFALAGVSSIFSLVVMTGLLINADGAWRLLPGSILIFLAWGAALIWRRRRTAPADCLPLTALRIAYLANAVLCLVVFAAFREPLGWSLTLIASVAIAADLLASAFRHRAPDATDGATPPSPPTQAKVTAP